jgi:chain length determinant protein (polysaccharide antigen chain regulator)
MSNLESGYKTEDEIDLFDLIDDIKSKWYWLVGTAFVGVVVAVLYALLAIPTYRTELVYKDVSVTGLSQLNQPRLKETYEVTSAGTVTRREGEVIFSISTEKAFNEVRSVARSGSVKRDFYEGLLAEENDELTALIYNNKLTDEQNFSLFSERIGYADPGAKEKGDLYFKITFDLSDPQWTTTVLNRYSEFVLNEYSRRVKEQVGLAVSSQLDQYHVWADNLRSSYLADKQLRIAELSEAAKVAASIDQQRPFYSTSDFVVSSEPPLYMMGQKALLSEIEQLKSRSSENGEDMYIKGLPELLWNISLLESLSIDWDAVQYVQLDQSAILPLRPVKPRKMLIVALGGVAGFMAGIMFALLAAANVRRKEQKSARRRAKRPPHWAA